MYWKSVEDFLHMGGYALYVWVSFAVTFGCMAIEILLLSLRKSVNRKSANRESINQKSASKAAAS